MSFFLNKIKSKVKKLILLCEMKKVIVDNKLHFLYTLARGQETFANEENS